MEDETAPNEPLNPYAKAFFGLWALVALLLVGFRAVGPTYSEQIDGQHRLNAQTGWWSKVDGEPNQAIGFLTSKTTAQPSAFTSLANGSLPPVQYRLSVAARTDVK